LCNEEEIAGKKDTQKVCAAAEEKEYAKLHWVGNKVQMFMLGFYLIQKLVADLTTARYA